MTSLSLEEFLDEMYSVPSSKDFDLIGYNFETLHRGGSF